ncbi:hypothetical protein [Mariniblastus fucicola]|uniref:HTTM domain-containing protein n=1 Tax=Mariniblastus fucicola TaxID=980251 RepID=A0A5B9P5A2_9BACT|nr:hypothetical protein [Mariniblastus fucicola]QEG20679.1 hypothetical protein MFFC18_05290 [Mariniblastus fucicola]
MQRFVDWLQEEATPKYGQIATWLLLLFAVVVALSPIEFAVGPRRAVSATIFSWLPDAVVRSPELFFAVRVVLLGSAIAWALRISIPYSCWLTVAAFTMSWALRMENLTNGAHIFNVTNWLLIIHAMWFHFRHREIHSALVAGKFWQTKLYPRWVFWLCIFYLGWFHTLAGLSKICASGFDWGDGVSLQLWTELFGWDSSPFGKLLRWDVRLTAWMQTGALIIECLSILCIFNRWFRYAIGLALFGFYLGVLTTFIDFGFHFNAILVAYFLLPVDQLLGLKFLPARSASG